MRWLPVTNLHDFSHDQLFVRRSRLHVDEEVVGVEQTKGPKKDELIKIYLAKRGSGGGMVVEC